MQTREDFEAMAHRRLADWTAARRHPLRGSTPQYESQADFRSRQIGRLGEYNRDVRRAAAESDVAALTEACRLGLLAMMGASTIFANFDINVDATAEQLAGIIQAQPRR